MPFELELSSELTDQAVFRFIPLFRYQELGSEIRQQSPFIIAYTPKNTRESRQSSDKDFSAFYLDDLAFTGTRSVSRPPSRGHLGIHTPHSGRSQVLYSKY